MDSALASIHIEAIYVAFIAGTIIPILTGMIVKYEASSGLKAVVALFLNAVVAVLNAIVNGGGDFVVRDTLMLFAGQFAWHVATHFGFWRPTGVSATLAPDVGIGQPVIDARDIREL